MKSRRGDEVNDGTINYRLGKIDQLAQFIVKERPKLSSPLELALLNAQLRSMQAYLESLDARIIYLRDEQ